MSTQPLDIAVIIPFYNKAHMTLDCVRSLLKYGPAVKEILLVSNNSSQSELQIIEDFIKGHDNIQLLHYNHPFNYQKINNWAVSQATAGTLFFLNNDTELREKSRGLVEEMYEKAQDPNVGIVGCTLLYGDEAYIQHAGVFLVSGGLADHMYVGEKYTKVLREGGKTHDMPYSILEDRPLSAATAAVNVVQTKKFNKVNGFDEQFIICGGDVDLCLRLNQAGFQTWFVAGKGGKYILHKESQSRAFKPIPYNDFYWSYLSYAKGYDTKVGDPFLPKICALKEIAL